MKHFLCYDHTYDSENLIPDGQEFLVEKPSEELYAKLEKALDKEFDKLIKIHFNVPLFLAALLSGGIAYIILSVFFTEIIIQKMTEPVNGNCDMCVAFFLGLVDIGWDEW